MEDKLTEVMDNMTENLQDTVTDATENALTSVSESSGVGKIVAIAGGLIAAVGGTYLVCNREKLKNKMDARKKRKEAINQFIKDYDKEHEEVIVDVEAEEVPEEKPAEEVKVDPKPKQPEDHKRPSGGRSQKK